MSLLQQILDGSLLSRQRLMQARQFYAPQAGTATPEAAYARWTERVSVQAELGSARELAGLSDAELSALESEFVRCPIRPRSDRFQGAFRLAAVLAALGVLGLALQALAAGLGDSGYRVIEVLAIGCLLAAVCVVAVGAYVSFGMLHLDLSHGTVGLLVGRLDEQHPWLYDSMLALRHPAAEEYRQQVLRERGPLRGADCVILREIVRVQDALERTRWARTVAQQVQRPAATGDAGGSEPRLVRVSGRGDQRAAQAGERRWTSSSPAG